MEFECITFDCYGTLIDWEGGIVRAFERESAAEGISLAPAEIVSAYHIEESEVESGTYRSYREILAETAARVAARLGWNISPDRAEFLAASLPHWRPFPDTNPALERLARKFKLGILSNIDDDLLAATRKHFTVEFELLVTAQQVRSYKPGLAHFQEARSRLGGRRWLHAAQSYFHDVVPASTLSVPVVWVNRKGEIKPQDGLSPTYEVRHLTDLAELLGA